MVHRTIVGLGTTITTIAASSSSVHSRGNDHGRVLFGKRAYRMLDAKFCSCGFDRRATDCQ